MTTKTITIDFRGVPALGIDKLLFASRTMEPRHKLERRIVWNLCKHMQANGWTPARVFDGEEHTTVCSAKAAMELIFNLDDARLTFCDGKGHRHAVVLVLGNGIDIVSDWGYSTGDPDGFDAAMDAFDAEQCA